ncbi:AIR carboxylase family protein [Thermoflexus hugenholtzii]|jgi:Phosphoribosylcarboxyaminoimidazole (NCAIR) mutase|uniref:Phosphoribosylaminoimidazole carboxylase n=1 Tax=Thermoflexus hugenholtzii JAD2 TaxID=877466 RepID=A0A212RK46_9CHLR|nr:AIR carboxylase family protein [Thermoflexus hugenholtzii]SNB72818.1 5-(carboxyamino)imidazole ribonucleotide mutase [Thermoflexus hugenholtzii JAD2]
MTRPLVVILMGSRSDLEHARAVIRALEELGLDWELRVASAHKVPDHLLDLLRGYEADSRPKVYITIAGRSNALSGMVDGQVLAPVIACPPISEAFGGADIFSSLRMPGGIAPAVVLDPAGAALLAAKILGLCDAAIRERVAALQARGRQRLLADDAEIRALRPAAQGT